MQDAVSANNGMPTGNLSYSVGEVGQGLLLDGTTASATIPASSSLTVQSLTIEGWINPWSVSAQEPIVEYSAPTGWAGVHLWLAVGSPGTLFANIRSQSSGLNQNSISSGSGLVPSNQWSHVAVTYDQSSGVVCLFFDGTNVAVRSVGSVTPNTGLPLNIGLRPATSSEGGAGTHFRGKIDELSLYNRALSAAEVQAIYMAGGAGKCFVGFAPTIQSQPTNQTANASGTAAFSVVAGGSAPLCYQWLFNGTNSIINATNSSLVLTNLQLAAAGLYSVAVTNPYGWTISSNAVLTVIPPPPCLPAPFGLVSWWRAEGDSTDCAGSNDGLLEGGVTFSSGEVGQALNFNGTSADVRVPASASLDVGAGGGLTVEGWIKPTSVSSQQPIVEWNSNYFAVHLWIGVNSPACLYGNLIDRSGSYHVITSAANVIQAGKYQHVAMTYNHTNGSGALYLNGVVVAQASLGVFTPQTTADLYLGYRPHGGVAGTRFAGQMDEISLYSRALSSNEIVSIYLAGTAGKCVASLAPVITTQPTNQAVLVGGTAAFTVAASGNRISYQWKFNGTNIAWATNATLTLTNVQPEQAGNYAALVSNPYGSTLSSNAPLTILSGPNIEVQPVFQLIMPGCDAVFSISASGSAPMSFQWWKDRYALSGETNSSLTIPDAQSYDLGRYFVVVSNPYGSQTSSNAMLAFDSLPVTTPVTIQRYAWGGVRIWAPNLVANDTDADGDGLSVIGVSPFSNLGGNVSLRGNWVFYAPPAGNTNADSFSYTVSDGHCGGTTVGSVAVQTRIDTSPSGSFFVENAGNGSLRLTFVGLPNQTYRLQYTQDLANSNWQDLGSWTCDTYGSFELIDTPPANSPARYYRTVWP